jgi:hypothetical protein
VSVIIAVLIFIALGAWALKWVLLIVSWWLRIMRCMWTGR